MKPKKHPALILIHGFRGSPLGLRTIANDLRAAGYDVYTPALPPFAGAKLDTDYTPESYADFLRQYIQDHQLVQPVLIGHSMGSIVVSAVANRYPNLINQKLILLSPISTKPSRFITRISPLTNYLSPRLVDYITTRYLFVPHNHTLFRETMARTSSCSADHPPAKSELNAAIHFSTNYSVADFLNGSSKDIIIIAGGKDRLIKPKATQKLADEYYAQLEFIPNSGHLHNYEKPHETAELILKALNK